MSVSVPVVQLASGPELPRLGLGTWPMDDHEAERAVAQAVELGYQAVDTAENYGNETGVGRGIRASGVDRRALFVTTKFNKEWHARPKVADAIDGSLRRLGLDYLDLVLIHWPNPDQDLYVQAWEGLVEAREAGKVRAIGTSNFTAEHLDRITAATSVVPDVNQIQLNPWCIRAPERADHERRGIVTQSWSPIGQGNDLLADPTIVAVAERVGRTPAQVVLRWHMEVGLATIPKSSDPGRQAQNLDIFDWSLEPTDIEAISALDGQGDAPLDSTRFGH